MGKLVMISNDYHGIGRLLLLTIIVESKNCSISILVQGNIIVNRQNSPSLFAGHIKSNMVDNILIDWTILDSALHLFAMQHLSWKMSLCNKKAWVQHLIQAFPARGTYNIRNM